MKTRTGRRQPRATARRGIHRRRRWSPRHIAKGPGTITVKAGKVVMLLPRRLRSPNSSQNWRAAHGDRDGWETMLRDAIVTSDGSVKLPVMTRMRLEITRLAPSVRYLLDFDNCNFCGKRFVDSLTAVGWIVDDNSEWLDGPHIVQGLSTDKCYWAIVRLTSASAFDATAVKTVNPREAREALLAHGYQPQSARRSSNATR